MVKYRIVDTIILIYNNINYTACNLGSVGTADGANNAPSKSNGIPFAVGSLGYTHIPCYVTNYTGPGNAATSEGIGRGTGKISGSKTCYPAYTVCNFGSLYWHVNDVNDHTLAHTDVGDENRFNYKSVFYSAIPCYVSAYQVPSLNSSGRATSSNGSNYYYLT